MTKAEANLIKSALALDAAEAAEDDPTRADNLTWLRLEVAKGHFRRACAEYRKVVHGESVATEVGQR